MDSNKKKIIFVVIAVTAVAAVAALSYYLFLPRKAAEVLPAAPKTLLESLAVPSGGPAATKEELDAVKNSLAAPGAGGVDRSATNQTLQSLSAPVK